METASHDRRGAAPAAGQDLLVCVNGQAVIRRAADGEFIIGREVPPSHIQVDHSGISRLHVRLLPGSHWDLVDYDSRNGVYLHGHRIQYETPITDGMTVHLGDPDGIPITFHYVAVETMPAAYAVDTLDPDIQRAGRAIAERYEELGLSPRGLCQNIGIDSEVLAGLMRGHGWPDTATRAALEMALAWPAGALDEVRRGQPHGEITDVITPAVRRALLVDSATVTLASIDVAIADLPPVADPAFAIRTQPMLRRLAALKDQLAAAAIDGSDVVEMLDAITRVYTRLLTPAGVGMH
jgi:FHA domain-containing protein